MLMIESEFEYVIAHYTIISTSNAWKKLKLGGKCYALDLDRSGPPTVYPAEITLEIIFHFEEVL